MQEPGLSDVLLIGEYFWNPYCFVKDKPHIVHTVKTYELNKHSIVFVYIFTPRVCMRMSFLIWTISQI